MTRGGKQDEEKLINTQQRNQILKNPSGLMDCCQRKCERRSTGWATFYVETSNREIKQILTDTKITKYLLCRPGLGRKWELGLSHT